MLNFYLKDHEHATFDDILGEYDRFSLFIIELSNENDSPGLKVEKMRAE